jgi:hypothetical protein
MAPHVDNKSRNQLISKEIVSDIRGNRSER